MSIRSATLFALSLPLVLSAVDPDRDFNGKWLLDESRGAVQALPAPPPDLLEIRQDDSVLQVHSRTAEADGPEDCSYQLDGASSSNRHGDVSLSTVLKWESDALLFNTIANAPTSSYTEMDRWELSRDHERLTIRRQVVDRSGQVEALLVYRRR